MELRALPTHSAYYALLSRSNFSFKPTAIIAQAIKTLHLFCEAVLCVKIIQLVQIAMSAACVSSESVLTSKHNIHERLLLQCIFLFMTLCLSVESNCDRDKPSLRLSFIMCGASAEWGGPFNMHL